MCRGESQSDTNSRFDTNPCATTHAESRADSNSHAPAFAGDSTTTNLRAKRRRGKSGKVFVRHRDQEQLQVSVMGQVSFIKPPETEQPDLLLGLLEWVMIVIVIVW